MQKHSPPHPRRVPAHLSVSLCHDTKPLIAQATDISSGSGSRGGGGKQSKVKSTHRQDSEESGKSCESNVKTWFEHSNTRPESGYSQDFDDNDPPYFLTRSSDSTSNNDIVSVTRPPPPRSLTNDQKNAATNASSADDYRSVIDDLTIENRKLKDRLRKYERPQLSHLEKDMMFELKIHGLPSRRRRELENVLREFASSIDGGSVDEDTKFSLKERRTPHSSLGRQQSPSTSNTKRTPSSSTSNSRPVDSAYASMSTSGPTSTSTLSESKREKKAPGTNSKVGPKDSKIHTFLHNIPEGLLPIPPPMMTEKQKKRYVVQRLEQLFTGKRGIKAGENSQPLQQQEVSRSAARADQATKDGGPIDDEGSREAYILSKEELDVDGSKVENMMGDDSAAAAVPSKQRPTRPLDLDPDRAQIPMENVEYIRHLGLSTPQLVTEDSQDVAPDADGWVYLNLLVNMAQLHIINVTPEFVRSALSATSEKFQISPDGRKVRWRGGSEGTRLSSESGASSARNRSPQDSESEGISSKRRKLEKGQFTAGTLEMTDPVSLAENPAFSSSFHYKPLFHHQSSSSDGGLKSRVESSSPAESSAENDNTSKKHSISGNGRARGKPRKQREDGPMVFYTGANFCTDLSGDRGNIITPLHVSGMDRDGYSNQEHDALGSSDQGRRAPGFNRTTSGSLLTFRPFKDYSIGHDPFRTEDNRPKTPECLADEAEEDPFVHDHPHGPAPEVQLQDFEASGLGGIQPSDHFNVRVEIRHGSSDQVQQSRLSKTLSRKSTAGTLKRSLNLAQDATAEEAITKQLAALAAPSSPIVKRSAPRHDFPVKTDIISERYFTLEPSQLPPPFGWDSTLSSSDGSSDASSSYSGVSHLRCDRTFLQQSHGSFDNREDDARDIDCLEQSVSEERSEVDSDDCSIDMLALARHLNPNGVAAQERAFAMELDDPVIMEEAVDREGTSWVKSSAATINDESGYSSVISVAG